MIFKATFTINLKTARVDALADKHLTNILKQDGLTSRESYPELNIHYFLKCFLLACHSDFISDMNSIIIPEVS